LIDRSGPLAFDQAMNRQMAENLNATIDAYVLTAAIAAGGTVSESGFSVTKLWGDVMNAGAQMLDSVGNTLVPTHFFAQPIQTQFIMSQVDGSGRPLVTPTPSGMWTATATTPDGQPPAGSTGQNLLGLAVFHDGNVPASGANAQLVVSRPSELFVQISDPAFRVIYETYADSLGVLIQTYCMVGFIARHAAATQTISGNAYPSTPVFA